MNARQSLEQAISEYATQFRVLEMHKASLMRELQEVNQKLARTQGGYEALSDALNRLEPSPQPGLDLLLGDEYPEQEPVGEHGDQQPGLEPVPWNDPRVPAPTDDEDDPSLAIAP